MDPMALVGSLISGGASLIGGQQSNAANAQQALLQDSFNAQMQVQSQGYNTQQAQDTRTFDAQMLNSAQSFNADQAKQQMGFQDTEMQKAMDFNASQASAQRDYETQMSSTAYQRAVSDMKAAGINPMLASMTGGASTPSGSSASVSVPSGASASVGPVTAPMASSSALGGTSARMSDVISPAVSNAWQAAKVSADIGNTAANTSQTKAQTQLTNQNVDVANSQADINNQTISNLRATYDNIVQQLDVIKQQAADYASSARLKDAQTANTEKDTALKGGQVSGFGFSGNPWGLWGDAGLGAPYTDSSGNFVSPSGTSFTPGNPGTFVPANPPAPRPNSNSVWGETGDDSHSWTPKGVQLW